MMRYTQFDTYSHIQEILGRADRYEPGFKCNYSCISCSEIFLDRDKKKYPLCSKCFKKYLMRASGTPLEGMDYIREIARIRDGHKCQLCDRKWKYGTRRFDIHHLNGECGKRSFKYDKDIDGLTTLCHQCHMNLESVREKMSNRTSERSLKQKLYQQNWERVNKPWLK